jgi:mycothiol synthase
MANHSSNLIPPTSLNIAWRPLQPADLAAITALTSACLAVDGGLPLAASAGFIEGRYLSAPAHATIGAFDRSGRLIACAAAQLAEAPEEYRGLIVGQVHPAYRRRGLGTFLMRWSIAQARTLLAACPAERSHVLCIATEALTEASIQLYARYGFAQQFGETVMRRSLDAPLPDRPLPHDITIETWTPLLAGQFFEAYQVSFRDRPGFPAWSAKEWIEWVAGDDTFLPELSLLVSRDEQPIGFIVCCEEWIVQVGVRPEERRHGLASALVAEALRRFRAAGGEQVFLDVNVNNPAAERVYARLGFEVVGQRGRYIMLIHSTPPRDKAH